MLPPGLYEQVINTALNSELSEIPDARKLVAPIDKAEASKILAQYLADVVQKGLENVVDNGGDISTQIGLANQIVDLIQNTTKEAGFAALSVDQRAEQLLALLQEQDPRLAVGKTAADLSRPETSIAQSSLFTGAIHEPQMYTELKKEIVSADRIDMLVSFIKWSGLRLLIDELREFTQNGGELRIITTSYMGATDVKAIEELRALPSTKIKVSYDTKRTRLHAKTYVFYRDTGFTTAYVGSSTAWFLQGIKESGLCLLENFKVHPNTLTQLRLFNFFCIFHLIRYMAMLEAFYCGEQIRPILLDFSGKAPSQSSVARASEMSYTQMHKSINRFYAWGYSQWLEENGFDKKGLLECSVPTYKKDKKISNTSKDELETLWSLAKERAENAASEDDARLTFGETMYDMLALEASSHPVNCLKILGTSSGILYPPDKLHPNKRFVLSQDVLEMMLRSCVGPDEVLNGKEIRERLWERFGIIIGGSQFELDKIRQSGMIMQVDEDALEANFVSFASALESMDFAEEMADGILQIRLGGLSND